MSCTPARRRPAQRAHGHQRQGACGRTTGTSRTVHAVVVAPHGGRVSSHLGANRGWGGGRCGRRAYDSLLCMWLLGLLAGRDERESLPLAPLAIAFVAPHTRALLAAGSPGSPARLQ
ncbi:hypothetical protein B0H10DRAFT_1967488 [Mycena sp. CBHHK59/15]|nr:hypothetical protein B0H10DRAFT_1967488 [Mycena sp. CBHHK59/15]